MESRGGFFGALAGLLARLGETYSKEWRGDTA